MSYRVSGTLRWNRWEYMTTTVRCAEVPMHGDCAGSWAACPCGWAAEYANESNARHYGAEHEKGHDMAEDQELERWVDWQVSSIAWHEARAEDLEEGRVGAPDDSTFSGTFPTR